MKTVEITLYNLPELKEHHPDAYASVFRQFQESASMSGPDWAAENAQSLRELLDAAGTLDDTTRNFTGRRAWAWLENCLLAPLRIPWRPMHASAKRRESAHYGRAYSPGRVHPCPFTGYHADEALLDDIRDSLRSGMTVGDALRALPDKVEQLNENDIAHAASEQQFLDSNAGTLYNDKGEPQ